MRLEMPTEFKTFDYALSRRCAPALTSRSSDVLRDKSVAALRNIWQTNAKAPVPVRRIRHDFPTEWRRFVTSMLYIRPGDVDRNIEAIDSHISFRERQ